MNLIPSPLGGAALEAARDDRHLQSRPLSARNRGVPPPLMVRKFESFDEWVNRPRSSQVSTGQDSTGPMLKEQSWRARYADGLRSAREASAGFTRGF